MELFGHQLSPADLDAFSAEAAAEGQDGMGWSETELFSLGEPIFN